MNVRIKTYVAGYKVYHTIDRNVRSLPQAAQIALEFLGKKASNFSGLIQDVEIWIGDKIVWQGWKTGIGHQSKFIKENLPQGELKL